MDCGWFDNRAEGLIVVHSVLLGETTNDLASLMAGKHPIVVVLLLVDPLASDDIGVRWSKNEAPGPVIDECPILIGHGCTTLRVS
jgi:hypothetical protein